MARAPQGEDHSIQGMVPLIHYVATFDLAAADLHAFEEYESEVLRLLVDHGGKLLIRLRGLQAATEIHVLRFESVDGYNGYLADGRRVALRPLFESSRAVVHVAEYECVVSLGADHPEARRRRRGRTGLQERLHAATERFCGGHMPSASSICGPGEEMLMEAVIDGATGVHQRPPEQAQVWGFFYGGLINEAVMRRVGFNPTEQAQASLPNFEIRISPLVNLVPSAGAVAFGLLLRTDHDQLAAVYGQLKARYVPIPVLAHQSDRTLRPALCYVVPDMKPGQAEEAHIAPLLESAEQLGFPEWYQARIRSFLPPSDR